MENFVDAVYSIDEPIMIIGTSVGDDPRVTIITEVIQNQHPIMVAVGIKGDKTYNYVEVESSPLITAFARSNTTNYVRNADVENRIVWIDNNKSQKLTNNPGVQFPNTIQNSSFDSNLSSLKKKIKNKFNNLVSEKSAKKSIQVDSNGTNPDDEES